MSKWDTYKEYFGDWAGEIKPFFDTGGLEEISEAIKKDKKAGKILCPDKGETIFRCFKETKLEGLKVVFLGLSPYFTSGVADGLCFSCGLTKKEQPSLKVLFDACEADLGYKDERNPDLKRWAEQGVLLLNSSLTTLANDARIHLPIWRNFIKFVFREIVGKRQVVVVFFGKDAQEFSEGLDPKLQRIIKVNHPSYFARNSMPMNTNLFSETNEVLKSWTKTEISWQEYGDLPWPPMEKQVYEEFI